MASAVNQSARLIRGGCLPIIKALRCITAGGGGCCHVRATSFLSTSSSTPTSRFTKNRHRLPVSPPARHEPQATADTRWSVIAYNLSDELRIENAHKLLENFKEYRVNEMSQDVEEEALMLSLKETSAQNDSKPFHDIFLFRDGSIVFWGVPYDQQKRILYGVSALKVDPNASDLIQEEREHMNFEVATSGDKSRLVRDTIVLANHKDYELLKLDQFTASHAICNSVKLGIWELILDQYIESIGWVTQSMKRGKTVRMTRGEVFKKTGEIYELKHRINLSSDLLDLPDIYWDRPEQENLFMSIISYMNVRRRTNVINEKLNNCCELMNLLAAHMNDKHHVRLEWMIIILILVEVIVELSKFV